MAQPLRQLSSEHQRVSLLPSRTTNPIALRPLADQGRRDRILRQLRATAEHHARTGLRSEPGRPDSGMLAGRHLAGRGVGARHRAGHRSLSQGAIPPWPGLTGSPATCALPGLPQRVAVSPLRRARGGCGQFGCRYRGATGRRGARKVWLVVPPRRIWFAALSGRYPRTSS